MSETKPISSLIDRTMIITQAKIPRRVAVEECKSGFDWNATNRENSDQETIK